MSNSHCTFFFQLWNSWKLSKLIQNLNSNKATQQYDFPIKILKRKYWDLIIYIIPQLIWADITPTSKKDEKFLKNNRRPASFLPSVSKIYEHCTYDHDYFHPLFSKLQYWFRKGFNPQHSLLILVEKYREVLDRQGYAEILLAKLPKAFDCINHKLLETWLLVTAGVPQGSILGASPFLNIYAWPRQ